MQRKTMKHKGGLSVLLALLVVLALSIGLSSCKDEDPGITMDTNLIGVWQGTFIQGVGNWQASEDGALTPRQAVVEVKSDKTFSVYMKVFWDNDGTSWLGYLNPSPTGPADLTVTDPVVYIAFAEARTNGNTLQLGAEENGTWTAPYTFTYTLSESNTKLNLNGSAPNAVLFNGNYEKKNKDDVVISVPSP